MHLFLLILNGYLESMTFTVNYKDEIQNSISFNIEKDTKQILEFDEIKDAQIGKEREIEKFNIIQTDSSTSQFVNLKFSTTVEQTGYNRVEVILKKPDGSESMFKPRTSEDGSFDVSLFIENSWDEGNYLLSLVEDAKEITIGEFSITKEKKNEIFILSEVLETANPELIYEKIDTVKISNDVFVSSNKEVHLDITGIIKDYSSGKAILNIYDKNVLFNTHKISPKSNGVFFTPILIDAMLSEGFHEINVIHDERVIGKSEFLITTPTSFYVEFGSEPIKISQDMFIESNNKVLVNILGLVKDFDNTNYNSVELTILYPDGLTENIRVNTSKWGYYSYSIPVTDKWQDGTYVISASFDGEKLGHIYLQITDFDINWLKTHTQKWIDGEISSYQYENRINRMSNHEFIEMKHIEQDSIPDWMKMNGEKWIDGDLSQKEYFDVIKFVGQ